MLEAETELPVLPRSTSSVHGGTWDDISIRRSPDVEDDARICHLIEFGGGNTRGVFCTRACDFKDEALGIMLGAISPYQSEGRRAHAV
jgi:hypothetical protein